MTISRSALQALLSSQLLHSIKSPKPFRRKVLEVPWCHLYLISALSEVLIYAVAVQCNQQDLYLFGIDAFLVVSMKDVDGAISKLFIEPAKCISYISLLEQKHLRGAQTPNRNEAEGRLGLWGLPAPRVQESLQWGVGRGAHSDALRMILFFFAGHWKVSVTWLNILSEKVFQISLLVATWVRAQPFPLVLLGPSGFGSTPWDPDALTRHFRACSYRAVCVLLKFATFPTGCDMKRPKINKDK